MRIEGLRGVLRSLIARHVASSHARAQYLADLDDLIALVSKGAVQFATRTEDGPDNCQFCLGAKGGVKGNENRFGTVIVCDYCTVLIREIQVTSGVHAPAPTPRPAHEEG